MSFTAIHLIRGQKVIHSLYTVSVAILNTTINIALCMFKESWLYMMKRFRNILREP